MFLSQCGYPWSAILGDAIAYYGEHQNSPPEAWFKVDGELIANYFGITQQRLITASSSTVGPSKADAWESENSLPFPEIPKQLQICLNYNRADPCTAGRRHVCAICASQHPAPQCPMALRLSTWLPLSFSHQTRTSPLICSNASIQKYPQTEISPLSLLPPEFIQT